VGNFADSLLWMEKVDPKPAFETDGLCSEADLFFIHRVLGENIVSLGELCEILTDAEMRRDILDSRCLFQEMVDHPEQLNISEPFYYTTLVRQVMLEAGLPEMGYTTRTVDALLRMIGLQRAHLDRHFGETVRYYPLNLSVLCRKENGRQHLRIFSIVEPYQLLLEGSLDSLTHNPSANGS
jgi:hypothetical protein